MDAVYQKKIVFDPIPLDQNYSVSLNPENQNGIGKYFKWSVHVANLFTPAQFPFGKNYAS